MTAPTGAAVVGSSSTGGCEGGQARGRRRGTGGRRRVAGGRRGLRTRGKGVWGGGGGSWTGSMRRCARALFSELSCCPLQRRGSVRGESGSGSLAGRAVPPVAPRKAAENARSRRQEKKKRVATQPRRPSTHPEPTTGYTDFEANRRPPHARTGRDEFPSTKLSPDAHPTPPQPRHFSSSTSPR